MSVGNHAFDLSDFAFTGLRGVYPASRGIGSSLAPYPKGCEEPGLTLLADLVSLFLLNSCKYNS